MRGSPRLGRRGLLCVVGAQDARFACKAAVLLVSSREVDPGLPSGAEVLGEEVVDRVALHLVRAHEPAVDLVHLVAEEGVGEGEAPAWARLLPALPPPGVHKGGGNAVPPRAPRPGRRTHLPLFSFDLTFPNWSGPGALGGF